LDTVNGAAAADLDDVDMAIAGELGHAISHLFRVAGRAKTRMVAYAPGVEWSTYVVLAPLMESGPLRSSALAETVHLDPSRVSRLISHVIELGLVARHRDPDDGRAAILKITSEGERLFHKLQRQRDEFLAGVVADWSERDRRTLAALLKRLALDFGDTLQSADASKAAPRTDQPDPQSKLEPA
jgi:DNA-binding MarR family transcriptional regulator